MRCAAAGDETDPHERLLADLQQVGAPIADRDRVAADLADRLRRAREPLGLVLDDERRALDAAVLLVGEERQDEVALGLLPRAQDLGDRRQDHGVHVLHVDRAAAPQHPVADLACEGIDAPVLGDRGDDVEVPVQDECGLVAVAPGHPGHHVGATRDRLVELGLETECREVGADVFGRFALPRSTAAAVVRRVEPDEIASDRDDLGERRIGRRHADYATWVAACCCDGEVTCGRLVPERSLRVFGRSRAAEPAAPRPEPRGSPEGRGRTCGFGAGHCARGGLVP